MNKKIFLIITFLIVLVIVVADLSFAKQLEITSYPGAGAPVSTKAFLPDYVEYLFNFGIGLAGLVAFLALIYGGFCYLTSAGNPSKMSEAQKQIFAALIGLVVILGSYLFLTTINPQLVLISIGKPPLSQGIILYAKADCNGLGENQGAMPEASEKLKSGKDYVRYGTSVKNAAADLKEVGSIYVFQTSDWLDVFLYNQPNFVSQQGEPLKVSQAGGHCQNISNVGSVELKWKLPGVYLCLDLDCKQYQVYSYSSAVLPKELDENVRAIKFKPAITAEGQEIKYGAILHEHKNFGGTCQVIYPSGQLIKIIGENALPYGDVSSVTVFFPSETAEGKGVTLYTKEDYDGISQTFTSDVICLDDTNIGDNRTSSIKIDGNYIAVLFGDALGGTCRGVTSYGGTCQIYTGNDPNVINEPIKRQASSLKVIKIK